MAFNEAHNRIVGKKMGSNQNDKHPSSSPSSSKFKHMQQKKMNFGSTTSRSRTDPNGLLESHTTKTRKSKNHFDSNKNSGADGARDMGSDKGQSRGSSTTTKYVSPSQIVGFIDFPELGEFCDRDETVRQFTEPKDLFPDALLGYDKKNETPKCAIDDVNAENKIYRKEKVSLDFHDTSNHSEKENMELEHVEEVEEEAKNASGMSSMIENIIRLQGQNLIPLSRMLVPGISRRSDFPLDFRRCALVIIDIQDYLSNCGNSYSNDPSKVYICTESLPNTLNHIETILTCCRELRQEQTKQSQEGLLLTSKPEIVFVYLEALTCDGRDVSVDYKLSGPLLSNLPNPQNPAKFLPSITPDVSNNEIKISKTSCNVFRSTNIDYVLRNLNIEQIILCGQVTNQCVESTCRDAADLGYFVTVVEDACAAYSEQEHKSGIHNMKGFSRIIKSEQVVKELQYSFSQYGSSIEKRKGEKSRSIINNCNEKVETPDSGHEPYYYCVFLSLGFE